MVSFFFCEIESVGSASFLFEAFIRARLDTFIADRFLKYYIHCCSLRKIPFEKIFYLKYIIYINMFMLLTFACYIF